MVAVVRVQGQTNTAQGAKLYVENTAKNEKAVKTTDEVKQRLEEWGYWQLVDRAADADYTLKLEVAATKGITATSWGGNSYELTAQMLDKKHDVIWESNTYRATPNGTNGFNAGKAVTKKLIRDLKKQYH